MGNLKLLTKMVSQISDAKDNLLREEGVNTQLRSQLKKEFKCETLEKGENKRQQLFDRYEQLETKLEESTREVAERYEIDC